MNKLASFNFKWIRRSSSLSAMISCQNKIEMGIWEMVLLLPRDGVLFIVGIFHARCRRAGRKKIKTKMAASLAVIVCWWNEVCIVIDKTTTVTGFLWLASCYLIEHRLFRRLCTLITKMVYNSCSLIRVALIKVYSTILGINPSC